jgi:threonyl-tRNA synthetase
MKTLNLHVDYIKWQALKKALKSIPDLNEKEKQLQEAKEALVVLTAIEKTDSNIQEILKEYIKNIQEIAQQINTNTIVLYPYAHLSSNLSSPDLAIQILEQAEKELKKLKFNVHRAPFGYYKTFELKVKGHPLSELSREIKIEGNEEETLTEEQIKRLLKEISKSKLDTSKLKENDHRIIGRKLDLWSFNEVAPGMVFWHDKGLHIKNKLIEYWREMHKKAGYQEISTPQIMDKKLWQISGHWDKYKENNFVTKYEKRPFLVKPMNCPGGMLVYKNSPKSYKDLPLRVGELGIVHRMELSGVLAGLLRVVQFTQDDAHIFCADEKQVKTEITELMNLINIFYKTFNLEFDHVELSTRPEKRIGADKIWDMAERLLEEVLKEKKVKYQINKGDGAFYGPKIDFHIKDSLGRSWQLSTIQLDFALPERFNLVYTDEKGNEKQPIMLHRVIYGAIERFLAILTENNNGKFPLWLSPNQIKILTMNDSANKYAEEIYNKISNSEFRVELDSRNESIGKKVREASIERFNYLITVGENEQKQKTIAVKTPDSKEIETMKLEEFIEKIKKEIREKK